MGVEELKSIVINEVDSRHRQLSELSLKIHSNPELGLQEVKAATWLTQFLEENGYCWQLYPIKIHHGDYCSPEHQAVIESQRRAAEGMAGKLP